MHAPPRIVWFPSGGLDGTCPSPRLELFGKFPLLLCPKGTVILIMLTHRPVAPVLVVGIMGKVAPSRFFWLARGICLALAKRLPRRVFRLVTPGVPLLVGIWRVPSLSGPRTESFAAGAELAPFVTAGNRFLPARGASAVLGLSVTVASACRPNFVAFSLLRETPALAVMFIPICRHFHTPENCCGNGTPTVAGKKPPKPPSPFATFVPQALARPNCSHEETTSFP